VDTNRICRPLEISIQHAVLNRSFADLKSHLPDDIAAYEDDVREIIDVHLTMLLKEQEEDALDGAFERGLPIVDGTVVFFFSGDMIASCKKLLMPLIEEYSKKRAKETVNKGTVNKREKQDEGQRPILEEEEDIVPLLDVARSVGEQYPELLDLQQQHEYQHGKNPESNVMWSADGRNDTHNDGPLMEFCRCALYSDEFQHICSRAVKAEISRLNSTRHGVSVSARSEGAAEIQSVGDSFESSFRTLCHLLQTLSKSLDTIGARALQHNEDDAGINLAVMKQELLLGCGSCLARLITEYYLFKSGGEIETAGKGNGLLFESHGENLVTSHFRDINLATLSFPSFALKCGPDKDGNPLSPRKYLQSVFPGSAGSNLAQMWSLCGGDGMGAEGIVDNEAGKNLKLFISHLESVCLTLVGIPFSILDKKTERKNLAARREGILDRLEHSRNEEEVVMCATVLIYHQIKNLPVAGIETINSVLKLFEHDRKIPQRVTEAILSLKRSDVSDSLRLISQVKRYGSAKNGKALAAVVSTE